MAKHLSTATVAPGIRAPVEPAAADAGVPERLAKMAALGLSLIAASLTVGILGYHYIAEQSWSDSFLNAAMILSAWARSGS